MFYTPGLIFASNYLGQPEQVRWPLNLSHGIVTATSRGCDAEGKGPAGWSRLRKGRAEALSIFQISFKRPNILPISFRSFFNPSQHTHTHTHPQGSNWLLVGWDLSCLHWQQGWMRNQIWLKESCPLVRSGRFIHTDWASEQTTWILVVPHREEVEWGSDIYFMSLIFEEDKC